MQVGFSLSHDKISVNSYMLYGVVLAWTQQMTAYLYNYKPII